MDNPECWSSTTMETWVQNITTNAINNCTHSWQIWHSWYRMRCSQGQIWETSHINNNLGSILMLFINLSRSNASMTYVSHICLKNIMLLLAQINSARHEGKCVSASVAQWEEFRGMLVTWLSNCSFDLRTLKISHHLKKVEFGCSPLPTSQHYTQYRT